MTNLNSNNLPRQVWAYYHPFYGTPFGPTGRWLTWNEPLWLSTGYGFDKYQVSKDVQDKLSHNPEQFTASQRRSNYSVFYPILGLYDVLDKHTLAHHARWAEEASLDGLIWDYMLVGEDNADKDKPLSETIYDRSFKTMLEVLDSLDVKIELSPWYDSFCWYNYPVEKIAEHLIYLVKSYHDHHRILHIDGRLVVFIYSTFAKHTVEDWRRIRSLLVKEGIDDKIFLIAGEVPQQKLDFNEPGIFNGFSQYNYTMEDWTSKGVKEASYMLKMVAERNQAKFWSATVGPGFDGRIWHHPGRALARGLGKLYESMWESAIASQPNFITVCSFNEWGEGTQIEPSLEHENLYIRLTAEWAKIFRQST